MDAPAAVDAIERGVAGHEALARRDPAMNGSDWSVDDRRHMARAIRLARRGIYTTDPNPRVGCVLVQGGTPVADGWHQVAGGPHAEIMALNAARGQATGSTCYVSLEPCCHHGRTPPCTQALIQAGVARVVAAMTDPDPRVGGNGLTTLKNAGISVESGLLEAEARRLNPGFIRRMRDGRPYVRCKLALSLDGRSALASGESKWITSPQARRDVQRLRARSSAVMTGIGTVLADDPRLTVRDGVTGWDGHQPLRVVLDSRLRIPAHARILGMPGKTLILSTVGAKEARKTEGLPAAEVVYLDPSQGKVALRAALEHLARVQVNEILLEAGPTLTGAMLEGGFVDELVIYLAPKLMGDSGRGAASLFGVKAMDGCLPLAISDMRAVGPDWRVTACVTDQAVRTQG